MRAILVLLVLTACAGDDDGPVDIHAIVGCDEAWIQNGFTACEAACRDSRPALGAMGPACEGTTSSGAVSCSKTFVFEGVTGCCVSSKPMILFAECL